MRTDTEQAAGETRNAPNPTKYSLALTHGRRKQLMHVTIPNGIGVLASFSSANPWLGSKRNKIVEEIPIRDHVMRGTTVNKPNNHPGDERTIP